MALKTWSTQYPTDLDTLTEQPELVNVADITDVSHVHALRDAVQNLQTEVGSDNIESGSLRERTGAAETDITTLQGQVGTAETDITTLQGQVANSQQWVDRGDPTGWDYQIGSGITVDNNYNNLDISSIVGVGRRLVMLRMQLSSSNTSDTMLVRTNGNTSGFNSAVIQTGNPSQTFNAQGEVWTDANGVVEVRVTTIGTVTIANLLIRGWFEPV